MIVPPVNLFRPEDAQRSRVVKSRGSSGPRSSIDAMDTTLPMFTALFNTILQHKSAPVLAPPVTPHSRKRYLSPTSSPAGPPSSPPPAQEDELRLCLEAFGRAKNIPSDQIGTALISLADKHYTPDTLPFAHAERLAQLTPFAEGDAAALIKFSKEWSGRIDRKRARAGPSTGRH